MSLIFNGRATRNFLIILCLMNFVLFIDRANLAALGVTVMVLALPSRHVIGF
jgi:hypothetical protein